MAKPTGSSHFSYDSLENEYQSLKNSIFSNIYNIFNNSCNSTDRTEDISDTCKQYIIEKTDNEYVNNFLKKVHHNFKTTYLTVNKRDNVTFTDELENYNEYYIYFKWWLYDEILSKDDYKSNVIKIYEEWEKLINDQTYKSLQNQCAFNKLELNDVEKLLSIYSLKLIFYKNVQIFKEEENKPCRYINYFGKGLKAYYESIGRCSKDKKEDAYCNEFREFQKIYMNDNIYISTSSSNNEYIANGENTEKCALVIESLKNPLLLIYKENYDTWHLSDHPLNTLNSSIISASSAIGATAAISAFLLYLFKFTNIGSLFGYGNKKDNKMFLNVDQGTHDFTFTISEPEHNNFGNNEYKISYYSSDNS
ncbi:PIR Superfamily Protein [Plasmodium ovale wallikeri]|uniref:PIR Superfamily Protein n=1 Tax=Plasmodium ovale wallikeri TaxID=864142 RepID=A0A1A9AJK8_PLAOA|nr:PIR Superfamily Protein [Plasmodium ovale wallikeri]SBT56951.1 PIR Superfamily Protein [Plasmodium ovale wallikeri]